MEQLNIKIKFDDLLCPNCGRKLYMHSIYRTAAFILKTRKGFKNNPLGTKIYLHSDKCRCGQQYKVYFDCHNYNGNVTMIKNNIQRIGDGY